MTTFEARLRVGVDIGGTFTDVVVDGLNGGPRLFKSSTMVDGDPVSGLFGAFGVAARHLGVESTDLIGQMDQIILGTTRATNAIVTSSTARTAYLCTEGHPDTLLWREGGGRISTLDFSQPYPEPYVPRSLTFEIPERIVWNGNVRRRLDEDAARATLRHLGSLDVEAIAVCLLWSIVNPVHEQRLGELIAEELPGVPFTLSHQLNPTIREYRRASSTVIDASLKPLMSAYFQEIRGRLEDEGFSGRLFVLTAAGGVMDIDAAADRPIHSIGCGPAAAPMAGRYYARRDATSETAIITDAGGTTYDVGLVRGGLVPWTRETIVGDYPGFILGFPSVDVRSVGAGGGSIASVDAGGLLQVGPRSAGSEPGPAAYNRGGTEPTVSDAAILLGYLDHRYFLGGEMALYPELSAKVVKEKIADPLGISIEEAASAIFELACERMVVGIEEITIKQGIDVRGSVLIGGGGGAGLYSPQIAKRLKVDRVIIPETSAGLSAAGALLSPLRQDMSAFLATDTETFDFNGVNATLADLQARAATFITGSGFDESQATISFSVEARYPNQNWEIPVALRVGKFAGEADVEVFRRDFHETHERLFAHRDEHSKVEVVAWHATAMCPMPALSETVVGSDRTSAEPQGTRRLVFSKSAYEAPVYRRENVPVNLRISGPAIVETPTTTVVVPPLTTVYRNEGNSLILEMTGG